MSKSSKRANRKSRGFRNSIPENTGVMPVIDKRLLSQETDEYPEKLPTDQSETAAASRVIDMSWAAKYIDDDWEAKYGGAGNFDTRVVAPQSGKTSEKNSAPGMFDLMEDSVKNIESDSIGIEDGMAETIGTKTETEGPDIPDSPMAATQEFRTANEESEFRKSLRQAAEMLERRHSTAVQQAAGTSPDEDDDDVKITDAETGKTAYSLKDAADVKAAQEQDPDEDVIKITDAATDRTMFSITDAAEVKAAEESPFTLQKPEIFDSEAGLECTRIMSAGWMKNKYKELKDKLDRNRAEAGEQAAEQKTAELPSASEQELDALLAASIAVQITPVQEDDSDRLYNDDDFYAYDDIKQSREIKGPVRYRSERSYSEPARYRPEHQVYDRRRRPPEPPRRRRYSVPSKSPFRFVPLVLVIAVCVLVFIAAKEVCFDVPKNSSDYSRISYTVRHDITTEELAADLQSLGIIDNPLVFRLRCLFYDLDCKDGTYTLSPCYSTEKIVNILSGYEYIDE
ncbi:MAG: hypothetical protein HUJ76_08070 [Parasporobacterium sp.]|nr:hypothetical protein [Parasporobacterium sp.]